MLLQLKNPDLATIGVIIIHYSGVENTVRCLTHLQQQKNVTVDLVLIDNSIEGNAPKPTDEFNFHVIRTENKGFSHANNLGLRYLENRNIAAAFLLNNDAFLEPEALQILWHSVQQASQGPTLGGALLLNEDGTKQALGGIWFPSKGTGRQFVELPKEQGLVYPVGAALMINRIALDRIEWQLCEDYFLYFEELDLVSQLDIDEHFTIVLESNARAVHLEGASAGSGHSHHDRSLFSEHHFHRSKALFYYRNFPEYELKMTLLQVLVCLKRFLKGDFRRAKVAWKSFFQI